MDSANVSSAAVGSLPVDSTNTSGDVKRRRLREAAAQRRRDKCLDAWHHLVRPQAAQHDEALKGGERRVEAAWKVLRLGRRAVKDGLPLARVGRHVVGQRAERRRHVSGAAHLAPCLCAQPLLVGHKTRDDRAGCKGEGRGDFKKGSEGREGVRTGGAEGGGRRSEDRTGMRGERDGGRKPRSKGRTGKVTGVGRQGQSFT
eukprot:139119-Chlamydomonas_euryale.AAC.2